MSCKKKGFPNCKSIIAMAAIFCFHTCLATGVDDYDQSSAAISKGHFEPVENLKNVAQDFVKKNYELEENEKLEIHVSQTDLPAKLAQCTKPIEAAFPAGSSKEKITAVELTCNGANQWHAYVPVDVNHYAQIVVAKKTIAPNQVITEDDLDFASYDTKRLYSGYYKEQEKNLVIGQTTSHPIQAGTVLNKKNLHTITLIHRNQEVTLVAKSHTVEVSMKGIAKSDGGLNEMISAYNPSSKKTLSAIVVGADRAEVLG